MIGLVVTLKLQDGKVEEFAKVFGDLSAKVLANEPGCKLYAAHQDMAEPNTIVIMEQYADQAALEAHGKTEYFRAAQPALGACLAGAPEMKMLKSI